MSDEERDIERKKRRESKPLLYEEFKPRTWDDFSLEDALREIAEKRLATKKRKASSHYIFQEFTIKEVRVDDALEGDISLIDFVL